MRIRHIINTCNTSPEGNGMDQRLGLEINTRECTTEPEVDEKTTGRMSVLPGDNPILGWIFGLDGVNDPIPDVGAIFLGGSSFENFTPSPTSQLSVGADLPTVEGPATDVVESPIKLQVTNIAAELPEDVEAPALDPSRSPSRRPSLRYPATARTSTPRGRRSFTPRTSTLSPLVLPRPAVICTATAVAAAVATSTKLLTD